jgi:hypothetical protein
MCLLAVMAVKGVRGQARELAGPQATPGLRVPLALAAVVAAVASTEALGELAAWIPALRSLSVRVGAVRDRVWSPPTAEREVNAEVAAAGVTETPRRLGRAAKAERAAS